MPIQSGNHTLLPPDYNNKNTELKNHLLIAPLQMDTAYYLCLKVKKVLNGISKPRKRCPPKSQKRGGADLPKWEDDTFFGKICPTPDMVSYIVSME